MPPMGKTPMGKQTLHTVTYDPQDLFCHTPVPRLSEESALCGTGSHHFLWSHFASCFSRLKRLCALERPEQFFCCGLIFIDSSRLWVSLLTKGQTARAPVFKAIFFSSACMSLSVCRRLSPFIKLKRLSWYGYNVSFLCLLLYIPLLWDLAVLSTWQFCFYVFSSPAS